MLTLSREQQKIDTQPNIALGFSRLALWHALDQRVCFGFPRMLAPLLLEPRDPIQRHGLTLLSSTVRSLESILSAAAHFHVDLATNTERECR